MNFWEGTGGVQVCMFDHYTNSKGRSDTFLKRTRDKRSSKRNIHFSSVKVEDGLRVLIVYRFLIFGVSTRVEDPPRGETFESRRSDLQTLTEET